MSSAHDNLFTMGTVHCRACFVDVLSNVGFVNGMYIWFELSSAPSAPEPFQTLGMLYEEAGQTTKALQVGISCVHY